MSTVGIGMVQTSIQNVFPGNASKADSKATESIGFGCVFDKSMQSQKSNVQSKQTKQAEQTTSLEVNNQNNSVSKKTSKTEQSEDLEGQQSISNTKEENLSEEEMAVLVSQLQGACDELKQVLLNQLGLSEEELDQALEALGMTLIDLFDPNQLTNFFLQINGAEDASALLTDEGLVMNLQKLVDTVDAMNPLKDFGLNVEDAKEILEQMKGIQTEDFIVPESKEQVSEQKEILDEVTESTEDTSSQLPDQVKTEGTTEEKPQKDATSSQENSQKQETSNEVKLSVNASVDVGTQTKIDFIDQLAPTSEAKEIVNQMVREIKVTLSPEQTSMEMVLTPESLGKVNLTVSSKNGVMTAHMVTETQVAKEAIESQLHVLKETFENQGVKVEAVEVTVAANQFDFMNQSQMNQKEHEHSSNVKKSNGKLRMMDEFEEVEETEASMENLNASIGKGTQIDITA